MGQSARIESIGLDRRSTNPFLGDFIRVETASEVATIDQTLPQFAPHHPANSIQCLPSPGLVRVFLVPLCAQVVELVDTQVSEACAARCKGSSPFLGTKFKYGNLPDSKTLVRKPDRR